jgi:glycosyltransferase involved in cell wall biosynthesis
VIRNGIDVEAVRATCPADLGIPAGSVVFGFVGRFEEQKGVRELARAWQRVAGAFPGARLVLIGWGQLEGELRDQLGAAPNVHWLGFREDVPSVMKSLDVLVAPFHQEGFGLVLVEAMAAGVPVVAARASSAPELIDDGVEGRLVPVRDADALADAMIELAGDPERRRCMGARGLARVERDFTQGGMLDAHEQLLAEVAPVRRRAFVGPRPADRESPRMG